MGEYKIKDLETLTGIKSHTIRIWEKRYGILEPERTETKIRTYSDTDLKEILNVAILNKNGWKISHIADLPSEERKAKVIDLHSKDDNNIHFEKLLLALIELDENTFLETINFLTEKYGLEAMFTEHLIVFLERIGVMWITGTIQPGQEHFISHLIRQKLVAAIAGLPVPSSKGKKVILFLPENEWHELGLLFYHYVLRSKGVYTFYLGQSLPYDSLIECVEKLKPEAVVTSVLSASDNEYYLKLFKKMKQDLGDVPIYAGGYQIKLEEKSLRPYVTPVQKVQDLSPLFQHRAE